MNMGKEAVEAVETQPKHIGIVEHLLRVQKAEREGMEREAPSDTQEPHKENQEARAAVLDIYWTHYKLIKAVEDAWTALREEYKKPKYRGCSWMFNPSTEENIEAGFENQLSIARKNAEGILMNFDKYCQARGI